MDSTVDIASCDAFVFGIFDFKIDARRTKLTDKNGPKLINRHSHIANISVPAEDSEALPSQNASNVLNKETAWGK